MTNTVPHPNPQETIRPDIESEFNALRETLRAEYISDRRDLDAAYLAALDANSTAKKTALVAAGLGSDGSTPPGYPVTTLDPAHNTAVPTISGVEAVGEVLTADEGDWDGDPTFTYQWVRADEDEADPLDIVWATNSTYLLVDADEGMTVSVRVKGVNVDGQDTASSEFTGVIAEED